MIGLTDHKNAKAHIIKDFIDGITYVPNRQADIYAFIKNYQSDEFDAAEKETILTNLANCIIGKSYHEPVRKQYYSKSDVARLESLMDCFIEKLIENSQVSDGVPANKIADDARNEINNINAELEYGLMDTWRREEIYKWLNDACEIANGAQPITSSGFSIQM